MLSDGYGMAPMYLVQDVWQGQRGSSSIQKALQSLLGSYIASSSNLGSNKGHDNSWRLLLQVSCVEQVLGSLSDCASTDEAPQDLLGEASH